jgi:L-arabinokinase
VVVRRIIHGSPRGLDDAARVIDHVTGRAPLAAPEARALFLPGRDVFVARAPGRLALFGSPGPVPVRALQAPVARGILVALQSDPGRQFRVVQVHADRDDVASAFEMPFHYLTIGEGPVAYHVARDYFRRYPDRAWAAGFAGAFLAFMHELGARFGEGARLLVVLGLPAGRGIGFRGAAMLAALRAISLEAGLAVDARQAVRLGLRAERLVAGIPTCPADLVTAARAQAGAFVAASPPWGRDDAVIRPAEDLAWWTVLVEDPDGASRRRLDHLRTSLAMADVIAASAAGLAIERTEPGRVKIADPGWRGLTALARTTFARDVLATVPDRLSGAAFLERYGGVADPFAHPEARHEYELRDVAAWAVEEDGRARECEWLLAQPGAASRDRLGALLFDSHEGGRRLGLTSPAADLVVEAVRERARRAGLLGAKATVSGEHAIAVVARADARPALEAAVEELSGRTRRRLVLLEGSSPGAYRFGHVRLRGA